MDAVSWISGLWPMVADKRVVGVLCGNLGVLGVHGFGQLGFEGLACHFPCGPREPALE